MSHQSEDIVKVSPGPSTLSHGSEAHGSATNGSSGSHLVFVLEGPEQPDAWRSPADLTRVEGILHLAKECGLKEITLIDDFSGTTCLADYFSFIQQHVDIKNTFVTLNPFDENCGSSTGFKVNLISGYSGKQDAVAALRTIAQRQLDEGVENSSPGGASVASVRDETLDALEAAIGSGLLIDRVSEPDLIVYFNGCKTLGEITVWAGAYSEFAFLDQPWHCFDADDLAALLKDFGMRDRRFGAV